jgi:hypothetical protein
MGEKLQMLGIATLGRRKWLLLTEVPGTDPAFSKDPVFSTLSSLRLGERLRIPGSKQNRQEKSFSPRRQTRKGSEQESANPPTKGYYQRILAFTSDIDLGPLMDADGALIKWRSGARRLEAGLGFRGHPNSPTHSVVRSAVQRLTVA